LAAQREFIFGTEESSKALAQMLFELSVEKTPKSEAEYVIARAVLLCVHAGNLGGADETLEHYTQLWFARDPSLQTHEPEVFAITPDSATSSSAAAASSSSRLSRPPAIKILRPLPSSVTLTPSSLPLFNFSKLLLVAAQRGSQVLFSTLLEKYKPALSRDPALLSLLDRIGMAYFGLSDRLNNPFGDFLKTMMAPQRGGPGAGGPGQRQGGQGLGGLLGLLGLPPPNEGAGPSTSRLTSSSQPSQAPKMASAADLD